MKSDQIKVDEALVTEIDFDAMRENARKDMVPFEEYFKQNHFYNLEYLHERYPDKETYEMRMTSFTTWAVITPDGEWHEPGEQEIEWTRNYYKDFIEPAIRNDWYMTIVDCHI